jgi:hypothetical protein
MVEEVAIAWDWSSLESRSWEGKRDVRRVLLLFGVSKCYEDLEMGRGK